MLFSTLKAVFADKPEPPRGELTATVSQAVQEHEIAIARYNRIACDILHGVDCHCCEPASVKPQ